LQKLKYPQVKKRKMYLWEWFAHQVPTLMTHPYMCYVVMIPAVLHGLEQSTLTRIFLSVELVACWSHSVVVQNVQGFVIKVMIANSNGHHQQPIVIVGKNVNVKL